MARIKAVLRNRALFDQIKARENRLVLAEELNKDLKENLSVFIGSINDLDKTVSAILENAAKEDNFSRDAVINSVKPLSEKILSARKHIASLDARIEKTINEWDNLKKDEIGLPVLESQINKFLHQDGNFRPSGEG